MVLAFCKLSPAQVMVLNGLTHEFRVRAGEHQKGYIDVRNVGKKAARVTLDVQDYAFYANGNTDYLSSGTLERSNASWIILSPSFITLESGQDFRFVFEIQVPEQDTLSGTFWSIIMVESDRALDTSIMEGGFAVSSKVRYGVQIVTEVPGETIPMLEFRDVTVDRGDSAYLLTVDIYNVGTVKLRPTPTLEVFHSDGHSLGSFSAEPRRLYPGTSHRFEILLPDLEPGKYTGILLADTEGQEVFGTQITLNISDD
jgi:hypothetical protein